MYYNKFSALTLDNPAVILIASPIILTIATIAAIALTFAYVRYTYKRGAKIRKQAEIA